MEQRFITQSMMESFEHYLTLEEKSGATVEKYMRDIRAFKKYLCDSEVNKEIVIAYKKSLINAGYAARSINSMLQFTNILSHIIIEITRIYINLSGAECQYALEKIKLIV